MKKTQDALEGKASDAEEIERRVRRAVEDDDLQGDSVDHGRREDIGNLD